MIFVNASNAQTNLVHNYSFEDTIACPILCINKLYLASNWFQPNTFNGNIINSCSSDYFHICTQGVPGNQLGIQLPKTGNAYSGIFAYYDPDNTREYIEGYLISPLIANKLYCVSFYVSLAENSAKAISDFGVYFSADSLLVPHYNAITTVFPQVTNPQSNFLNSKTNWMQVSGYYLAQGGEQFLTIGNFKNALNTNTQNVSGGVTPAYAYYYIDDVSVLDCDSLVGVEELQVSSLEFQVMPNPAKDMVTIKTTTNHQLSTICIYNVLGEIVYQSEIKNPKSEISISLEGLNKGVYFITVIADDKRQVLKLVKE
jgi:hypothetical protein